MSGDRYRIDDQHAIYFVTFTVVDWVDVFTRESYKTVLTDSLNYCIKNKGLTVYAYCIMTNHMHLICRAREEYRLSDIIRDYKKYTAKSIIKLIQEENESRKDWMLYRFKYNGRFLRRIKKYKFWRDDNHAILLDNPKIMDEKLEYIHQNPVKAGIVDNPELLVMR